MISRIGKLVFVVVSVLFLLLFGLVIVFWAPDLSKTQLREEYASSDSRFYVDSNGNTVHYRDQGVRSGPVVVMIHGTSASLHTWEPLIQSLEKKYRLISFDLPGHGLTGEVKSREYSSVTYTRSLIQLLDHLDIQSATLMGNSLGGRIAWQTAKTNPTRVNTLILLAPAGAKKDSPARSNIGFKVMSSKLGRYLALKLTPRSVIERSLHQTLYDKQLVSDSMVDRYWRLLRMKGNRQAMSDIFSRRLKGNGGESYSIPALNHPKLIIWGEEDQILPIEMLDQFEHKWPESMILRLPKVGHLPQEEAIAIVSMSLDKFCGLYIC